METASAIKACKMCCLEIPQQARKCPHCHHFQNRAAMLMFHPSFVALYALLPMAVMMYMVVSTLDTGEDYETYKDQIVVTDSEIAFGNTKAGGTVAVIGTIKNASLVSWKDIYFHIDFLDAAGQRVDVGEKKNYDFRLPAGETSSFKVSFGREFSETNYVSAVVRVFGAKDVRARW